MFTGLSAFPLTPVTAAGIDEQGLVNILARLTEAGVDSLGVLGSTGSFAYLTRAQKKRVAELAAQHAGGIPLMIGVGAYGTEQILQLADDAQTAGADALLLPVLCYQPLTDDEVFAQYETVTRHSSVPLCVYNNPRTTGFEFSDELLARVAALPGVQSVKMPGVRLEPARMQRLREILPAEVAIGVSGDEFAGRGLNGGCEVWYSVCGGLFPHCARQIVDAARAGDGGRVSELIARLEPLWQLFRRHGSIRVMAAAAGILGLSDIDCLPRPLQPLSSEVCGDIAAVMTQLELR
ncbi:dihydrodipicolinate synthase family protein [Serratia rubidaea]|uniref:dihydrodipicolinate synthase family protein n=1 Tax=Serratia rubidaea TaxID=61652 RepID=UPI001F1C84B3|nr:dihydrodipicolinate synthase family protein [Serratia rubidaea]UJD79326.1 dihydrodipicolinate synthase family protein [Serratia rubidaea]UJD83880.1 dihydrodipicolinate synthase family protein [Serratia rubidaea]